MSQSGQLKENRSWRHLLLLDLRLRRNSASRCGLPASIKSFSITFSRVLGIQSYSLQSCRRCRSLLLTNTNFFLSLMTGKYGDNLKSFIVISVVSACIGALQLPARSNGLSCVRARQSLVVLIIVCKESLVIRGFGVAFQTSAPQWLAKH